MPIPTSPRRNLPMEICKMIAALAVVILHVEFPGDSNAIASVLCQFANPVFFAITGYFNYRATESQLRRRLKHIADLYITGWAFHLLYSCIAVELDGGSTIAYLRAAVPDLNEIFWWIAYQQDSFLAQLWFLASTGLCYLVLLGYTRFAQERTLDYRPLYCAGFSLFSIYFLLNMVLPVTGQTVNFYLYRNGWFFGIPLFLFGMFLHEYQQQVLDFFRLKAWGMWMMIFGGLALSLLQFFSGTLMGQPFGTFVVVLGLMLLLISHPVIPGLSPKWERILSKFGVYSTGIYLFHITIRLAYDRFLLNSFQTLLGSSEPWLRSFVIYFLSLIFAVIWERGIYFTKKLLKKR